MSNILRGIVLRTIAAVTLVYGLEYISSIMRKHPFQHPSVTTLVGAILGANVSILRVKKV